VFICISDLWTGLILHIMAFHTFLITVLKIIRMKAICSSICHGNGWRSLSVFNP
jgi:hypothetical protein